MDIKVIFEDSDFLIIDKPAGLIVDKSTTTRGDTLQDFLEEKYKQSLRSEDLKLERAGIVHRIDKETSGLLIVAKNAQSLKNLQRQFRERHVKKTYIALVHGKVLSDGEVSVPVGRLPWNKKKFGVLAGGRNAVTRYRVISNFKYQISNRSEELTLLELYPQTGRTHQIRVHMKYLNHPIFADELYVGRKTSRLDRKILPRLFLHASQIQFSHPKTGKTVQFKSELPPQLLKIIS